MSFGLVKYNDNSISNITTAGTLSSGSLVKIQTQTGSGASSIAFTSGIDSTYRIYIFKFINIHPSGTNRFQVNFSSDGGSNYNVSKTTNVWIAAVQEGGSDNALTKQTGDDLSVSTSYQDLMAYGNQDADDDHSLNGTLHLFDPSNTTFWKNFSSRSQGNIDTNYTASAFVGGQLRTTSAINAVRFQMSSGTFDGTIKMYGLKDS